MTKEIMETWYMVKEWSGEIIETTDIETAKLAIREGRAVFKNTRTMYESGPSEVRLQVSTEIKQVKQL